MKNFLICFFLFAFAACNHQSTSGDGHTSREPLKPIRPRLDLDHLIEGQYLAVFETLNPQITSTITGAFTFSREIEIDEMVGDVRITNAGAQIIHSQSVRVGNRCPGIQDDVNGDGIIDAREGESVYGKIFFPLDGDLSTQSSHDGEFPMGDTYGNYIYSRVAKFSTFVSDLRNSSDIQGYIKLKQEEPLTLEGRVVIVQGVDEASDLPGSVLSVGRLASHQTLPIVCGVIQKVVTPPEDIGEM